LGKTVTQGKFSENPFVSMGFSVIFLQWMWWMGPDVVAALACGAIRGGP
jgi:hypothetical protein